MTQPMKVRFTVGQTGVSGKILLDDIDISNHVRAVAITADVNAATSVTIQLVKVEVEVDAEVAVVGGVVIPLIVEPGIQDETGLGDNHRRYKPTEEGDAA